jgi:NAD(P)H-quinone oxidoreductase subunit 6
MARHVASMPRRRDGGVWRKIMDIETVAHTILFYACALTAVGASVGVAMSRNIVRSAFSLLASLLGVAGLYALAGADFLAGIQLLIYVGGILVLILFAVMLTHRIADVKLSNASAPGFLAVLVVVLVLVVLAMAVRATAWTGAGAGAGGATAAKPAPIAPADAPAGAGAAALPPSQARAIGERLVGKDLLAFEVSSILLLAALIGAAHVARKEIKNLS